MEFKRLLYMSELPPSTAGGQQLIVRKLLGDYDMERLDVLCDARYHRTSPVVRRTFLPCRHTVIRNAVGNASLRPRRFFGPVGDNLNLLRIGTVVRAAGRVIRARGIEGILTVPWRCDFALAAYRVSMQTGLPLYVFETDDWHAMNSRAFMGQLIRRNQQAMLRHAAKLWVISPSMADRYHERFGVRGDCLLHYLDPEPYEMASAERRRLGNPGVLKLVYTGAVNTMFWDTLLLICRRINAGLQVEGRRVELDVYGGGLPDSFRGPHVHYRGLVASDEIPAVLAAADVSLIAITFDTDADLVALVRTSIYTKTIDYLASARPALIVAPPYAAEVAYFREVATVVDTPDPEHFDDALALLATDDDTVREKCARGLEFVRANHSLARRDEVFLRQFAA